MTPAERLIREAADLVGGARQGQHGDKLENHQNIADLWNAFIKQKLRPGAEISAAEAAQMMGLVKTARTKTGDHNPDDYVDQAGYAGVAGEIAAILADPDYEPPKDPEHWTPWGYIE